MSSAAQPIRLLAQVTAQLLEARQFGSTEADVTRQLDMLVAAIPEWATVEKPSARQPRRMLRINRELGANLLLQKVVAAADAARDQCTGAVTSPLRRSPGASRLP